MVVAGAWIAMCCCHSEQPFFFFFFFFLAFCKTVYIHNSYSSVFNSLKCGIRFDLVEDLVKIMSVLFPTLGSMNMYCGSAD